MAVAVSGGSDSLGLLVVLAKWAQRGGPEILAVTVDHQLRAGSDAEAAYVGEVCEKMGIAHAILVWKGWDGQGNLPDQARRARYALMADWAEAEGVSHIAVAHTQDDVAETFLMRLAREAGVDGLSAMVPRWRQGAVAFCRPALGLSREDLRNVLRAEKIEWVEDPGNADPQRDRTRARAALVALEDLGITARGLSNVARHLLQVRKAINWYVFLAARDMVSFEAGDVIVRRKPFRTLPRDVARRLVQHILMWISGSEYPPRGKALELLLESIFGGTGMTLHGCVMTMGAETIRFGREPQAVAGVVSQVGDLWDRRWLLKGPWPQGACIAALGEAGLQQCPDEAKSDLPEVSLRASPAVWRGDILVAAPLAGYGMGWTADLVLDEDDFFATILSH